ncbi:hypothetical protein F9U64_09580 [Gracilibacillus oryzae]|uniref:RNA polymerase sigma factor 70 region 4 type 2 domain-containing protein n=1 Tax=Gracilibacillus oryzae TaxID=1672701 RepID=A0A7C8GT55_9BACI|nr:hypothetical protein [Gracilibacillus oryzae]KAB8136751.1 hypothetical protein F9U64_09580 [Gracilibacillus oryzae]
MFLSFMNKFIFKAIVERNQAKVYQLCYLLTNERPLAEEITCQVFNKIYEKGNFRKIDHLMLYQQVIDNLQDSFLVKRKEKINRKKSVGQELPLINEAILHLPVRERMVLGLAHVCLLPVEVISSLLDVPAQDVKKSLYHSREFLTAFLKERERRDYKLLI